MNYQPLFDYISQYVALTEDDRHLLQESTRYRKYLKGQYLVQQGDICQSESFVVKGCLKTFHMDREAQEHIVAFAIENWWTADLGSFITQTPADYNVQCIENSEVIQFHRDNIEELFIRIPVLERFFRIIIQNAYVSSEKRIVRNFSLPAKERYLLFREHYPEIEQRVPQYMIASYLGITKEFLSKIRSQLTSDQY